MLFDQIIRMTTANQITTSLSIGVIIILHTGPKSDEVTDKSYKKINKKTPHLFLSRCGVAIKFFVICYYEAFAAVPV